MGGYPVLKGASYVLAVVPDMVLENGTTQTTEKIVNPDSEYLKELPKHLRSYEDAVSYQTRFILEMRSRRHSEESSSHFSTQSGRMQRETASTARLCRRTSSTD